MDTEPLGDCQEKAPGPSEEPEGDNEAEAPEPPSVMGIMSGPRAPVECALAWMGWKLTSTWGLEGAPFNEPADILDKDVQKRILEDAEKSDASVIAMCCKSFSRLRGKPIPGVLHVPNQRRSNRFPEGLPELWEDPKRKFDREMVEDANRMVKVVAKVGEVVLGTSGTAHEKVLVSECPERAYFWDQEGIMKWAEHDSVEDHKYQSCCFAGARCKDQLTRANFKEMADIRCECHHMHEPGEWDPVVLPDKTLLSVREEEAQHTAELAFAIAAAMTRWALRTGRFKLKSPRAIIRPQETGSRVGWTKLPAHMMRSTAMVGVGLRLGLSPPTS